jgi:hypothetical protein
MNEIEEDMYLGSSDKLVFLMREFKSELHPEQINCADPLLISKLKVSEGAKYDFPRIKLSEIAGYEEMKDD